MKHAFLIIAHNNWWQLKQLLQKLDSQNHDLYIHIDKKSKDFKIDSYENILDYSQMYFFQTRKVFWGGFSQVEVELFLLEKAYALGYDYYHIISGVDLPLKDNKTIDEFFEKNNGKEFIQYDDRGLQNNPEIQRRTQLYHFLQNYRRRFKYKVVNKFFTFLERILLVLQIALRVNRVKNLDWVIKYGSNWVSITHDLVQVVLDQRNKIGHIFSFTNCADELFIQTVAYNSGFQNSIYSLSNGESSNMRLIDWSRGKNGNPYTFRKEDYKLLMSKDALFARKFSETVDKEIIMKVLGKSSCE